MAESLDRFIRDLVPPDSPTGEAGVHPPERGLPGLSVENWLARGGMGTVYLARQRGLDREVAVKVMMGREGCSETAKRFRHEAWVLGRLEHPNIVPIHEVGTDDRGLPFYTMKRVKGRTLQHIVHDLRTGDADTMCQFPLAALLTVFCKVCDAMAFAHSQSVIHRDLKPENIMVGEFGEVLVMDWGLAKVLRGNDEIRMTNDEAAAHDRIPSAFDIPHSSFRSEERPPPVATVAGAVLGTPHYMSPEQAHGRIDALDERSDIYSLGCVLYAILTLRPPVEGTTLDEVLAKVREGRVTAPSEVNLAGAAPGAERDGKPARLFSHLPAGRVPAALSAVVMKAMQADPARRYASVQALSADIAAYQAGFATSAENASIWKQAALLVKRNKAASIGAAAVLVIGGALGTKALVEGRRAEQALRDLRLTAPVFQAQARLDFEEGRFDEAIRKIGYAIQLDENQADYRIFRANLFQSSQQLAKAAEDYRRAIAVRPADAEARKNLALTEKWLRESGGGPLSREQQIELLVTLREQKRLLESVPLAQIYDPDPVAMKQAIERRLQAFTTQPGWGAFKRVNHQPDGTFSVDLSGLLPRDLSVLDGFPISHLQLAEAAGSDISRLPRLPLRSLSLIHSEVKDLSSLHGMPLENLSLAGLPIEDLSPLEGMKLRSLGAQGLRAKDFSSLRGMPLESIDIEDCIYLADLEFLRGAPLTFLAVRNNAVSSLEPIAGAPLKQVSFRACPVSDAAPLLRCPTLEIVGFRRTQLRDVSLLAKLPKLVTLDLEDSPVSDLEPLRGTALSYIRLTRTEVKDVAPLEDCKSLEHVILPAGARNVERLRGLPKLKRISEISAQDNQPRQTAEEFWKEFDEKKEAKAP